MTEKLQQPGKMEFVPPRYIDSRRGYWLRFAASAVLATVSVLLVLSFAIGYYEPEFVDPVRATMQEVVLVDAQDPELKQVLADSGIEVPVRQKPQPPTTPLPVRQVSGFVQIAYTVNPDGTTGNIRVLGAVPRGYYEQQAVAEVAQRMHSPGYEDGEPVAREMETVIEFTVPADAPRTTDTP